MSKTKDRTPITPRLKSRVKELRKKARDYLVKTEIVQFRLDEESYRDLFAISERLRSPIGTIVREWTTAKIRDELKRKPNKTKTIANQFQLLQQQIDDLKASLG